MEYLPTACVGKIVSATAQVAAQHGHRLVCGCLVRSEDPGPAAIRRYHLSHRIIII